MPRLVNPADVVRWNTDKRYLAELAAAGVPVVPTAVGRAGRPGPARRAGEYVIKPAVSAGSRDTGRYDLADPEHRELAVAHLRRLADAGRLTMVQPYLRPSTRTARPRCSSSPADGLVQPRHPQGSDADRPGPGSGGLYKRGDHRPGAHARAELAVADKALAAVPGGRERLLYARVDLIPGPDGDPVLVELELTEPSLFLGYADGAADRLADAIVAQLTLDRWRISGTDTPVP